MLDSNSLTFSIVTLSEECALDQQTSYFYLLISKSGRKERKSELQKLRSSYKLLLQLSVQRTLNQKKFI